MNNMIYYIPYDIHISPDTIKSNPWMIGACVIVLVLLFIIIFKTSLKLIFKILINTVVGFCLLYLLNLFGGAFGISLGINWINAIIAGVLGLPGIALLLILRWMGIM